MARTQDGTRLSNSQASAFRSFVRKLKSQEGITTAALAEHLGLSTRQIDNHLSNADRDGKPRALLGGRAMAILNALAALSVGSEEARYRIRSYGHRARWIEKMRSREVPVEALVPADQVERLATLIVSRLPKMPGISAGKLASIKRGIVSVLKAERENMALMWANTTSDRVAMFAQRVEAGLTAWHPNGDVHVDGENGIEMLAREDVDVIDEEPSVIAFEAVHLAASMSDESIERRYDATAHKKTFVVTLPKDIFDIIRRDPDGARKALKDAAQEGIAAEVERSGDVVE